jgi:NDP-sugar pyrophosphorylase family protein
LPWEITNQITSIINKKIETLGTEYDIENNIAVHKSAIIEKGAILKGPIIIMENAFVATGAYLRGGVFIGREVKIGPGVEIKSSLILHNSSIAHFNFIGDSIIGNNVNFEAGSIIANFYNEREMKMISVLHEGKIIETNTSKFGALVGDNSKIGANAVLSPGILLMSKSIVKRLELIEQNS